MFKTLLTIIVSIVMAMSGTASMPAVPETEQILTVSDFTLSVNGETVALDPAAQLSAALGSDELDLHFQMNMPDSTLMPVSGKLTKDGAQFIISETGKAYSISEDTIFELLGISEEDIALSMLENYASILKLYRDPEFIKENSDRMLSYLTSLADEEPETAEIEWNGETLPAKKWIVNTDVKGIYGIYDVLMTCGNADMENYMKGLLDMMRLLIAGEEASVESYADLADLLGMDMPVYMEFTIADNRSCINLLMNMAVEDELEMVMTTAAAPDGMSMNMEMNIPDECNSGNVVMDMNIAGPANAPESALLTFGVTMHNEFSYSTEYESGEEGAEPSVFTNITDSDVSGSFSWINVDGLSDMDAVLTVGNRSAASMSGEGGYDYDYESAVEMNVKYSESAEEDGSITGHIDFDMLADDMPISCSLNINRAESAYEDYFAGYETAELTADTESDAYNALSSDLLCLIGDATAFSGDESVQRLVDIFTAEEMEVIDDEAAEYDYEDPAEEDYAQQLTDALAAFKGTPVNYTAPDGYVVDYVYASDEGDYISVDYADPATGDMFELTLSAYDEEATDYEYLPIGAAEAVTGPVAELQLHRGAYNAAIIRLPLGDAMVTFPENADFDAVQSILAGIEIG